MEEGRRREVKKEEGEGQTEHTKKMLASPRWMAAPGIVLAMMMVTGRALRANGACFHVRVVFRVKG